MPAAKTLSKLVIFSESKLIVFYEFEKNKVHLNRDNFNPLVR